jgi:hypothetical protein
VVTYSYKTSNGNTFYDGNGYDKSDIGSILLDAVLSVAVMRASQQMAAALLKVQCRLQVAPRSVASPVAWAVGDAGVARRDETEAPSHGGAGVEGGLAGAASL